jgi:hypothetical protein
MAPPTPLTAGKQNVGPLNQSSPLCFSSMKAGPAKKTAGWNTAIGDKMGILRNTLIIGAIALALPTPPPAQTPDGSVPPSVSPFAYFTVASETFADVRAFCLRKPGVCQTLDSIAVHMQAKAKYSAKVIYEWANEAAEPAAVKAALPGDLASADPGITGSTGKRRSKIQSQSTLRIDDLLPEWTEPKPRSKG